MLASKILSISRMNEQDMVCRTGIITCLAELSVFLLFHNIFEPLLQKKIDRVGRNWQFSLGRIQTRIVVVWQHSSKDKLFSLLANWGIQYGMLAQDLSNPTRTSWFLHWVHPMHVGNRYHLSGWRTDGSTTFVQMKFFFLLLLLGLHGDGGDVGIGEDVGVGGGGVVVGVDGSVGWNKIVWLMLS